MNRLEILETTFVDKLALKLSDLGKIDDKLNT